MHRPLRFLRDALTVNTYLKLLSFALAVVLWALVAEEQNVEENAEVFLDLKRPAELVLLNPPPPGISVRVMGARSKLKYLRSSRLELVVDLTRAKPGEMVYNFVGQRIRNLPSGVEVTAYSPASLKLQFDERVTRKLPVRPRLVGEPAAGYKVQGIEVEPSSVNVEGPQDELKSVREVLTEPIQLAELKAPYEGSHPLSFNGPNIHVIGARESVNVRIQIAPVIEQRQFDDVEVVVPETMGRFVLNPDSAKVVLEGPREALEAIQPSDVRIFLQEGAMPLHALQDPHVLRYPAPEDDRGLPRLLVSWPREDVIRLKRISPSGFQFRVLKSSSEAGTGTPERRGRKADAADARP